MNLAIDITKEAPVTSNMPFQLNGLYEFVSQWVSDYEQKIKMIPLFQAELTQQWTLDQKVHFAKVFYHIRGHFHDFLWHMGNHAPNKAAKNIILQNLAEEFGGSGRSHEVLFYNFADSLKPGLSTEVIDEEYYLPFVKEFNYGHLKWLRDHDWYNGLCAFAAYEKLDNIDYQYLYLLIKSLGVGEAGLLFFLIHKKVEHFETALEPLLKAWSEDPQQVQQAFDFIGSHQLQMWNRLSEEISGHGSYGYKEGNQLS